MPSESGDRQGGAESFWRRYSGQRQSADGDEEPGGDPAAEPVRPGSAPDGAGHRHVDGHECLDWCPICRGAELLRAAVPPELHDQFQTVQRDMLLMAQALIEAHLERMGRSSGGAGHADAEGEPPLEDIPIR